FAAPGDDHHRRQDFLARQPPDRDPVSGPGGLLRLELRQHADTPGPDRGRPRGAVTIPSPASTSKREQSGRQNMKTQLTTALTATLLSVALAGVAGAQDFPTKPIN